MNRRDALKAAAGLGIALNVAGPAEAMGADIEMEAKEAAKMPDPAPPVVLSNARLESLTFAMLFAAGLEALPAATGEIVKTVVLGDMPDPQFEWARERCRQSLHLVLELLEPEAA